MAIKERLRNTPVIGPVWRSYTRYGDRQGNRLAAAVTYYGFLSLFPLITLAAAVIAAALDEGQVRRLEEKVSDQIPGIADKLDIGALVDNAGTVGVIGGVLLLFSGLGWVDATRSSIRAMWDEEEEPGNVVTRKLGDIGALIGLGLAMALSVGASAFATVVLQEISRSIGLDDRPVGRLLLQIAATLVAVGAGVVLFLYLLVGVPRLTMGRRTALTGALIGAVGFELLKALVASYIAGVAGKSVYGAFGVPVALLLWIYLVIRLVLFCAAWTANAEKGDGEAAAAKDAGGQGKTADDEYRRPERQAGGPHTGRVVAGWPGPRRPAPAGSRGRPGLRTFVLAVAATAGLGIVLERLTRGSSGRR